MDTRHLVDPELLPMVDSWPTTDLGAHNLEKKRAQTLEQFGKTATESPVTLSEVHAPGPAGSPEVRLLIYRPPQLARNAGAIFHIHGGGMVSGTPEMMDAGNRKIAQEAGCLVVSVDYRLAPETPHPGPIEDCYAGLKWLHGNAGNLGIDADALAVMGESAGGGLAASLALLARDRGEVPIKHQFLMCPMLDDRTCINPPNPYAGEFVWTCNTNYFGWSSLLGCEPGSPGVSPYASPARADDLSGLPPAYIYIGALDLFVDECLDYSQRLIRAGVATEFHIYPGAFHGFNQMVQAAVAKQCLRDSMTAICKVVKS